MDVPVRYISFTIVLKVFEMIPFTYGGVHKKIYYKGDQDPVTLPCIRRQSRQSNICHPTRLPYTFAFISKDGYCYTCKAPIGPLDLTANEYAVDGHFMVNAGTVLLYSRSYVYCTD